MSMSASKKEKAVKSQLDDIVRNLRSDLQVWNRCHSMGWAIVNDLAKMHGECLTITQNLENYTTKRRSSFQQQKLRRLRAESKKSNERLILLVDKLLDSTEHTRESLFKLRQLCCDTEMLDHIFYRTRQLRDLLEFVESIMILYDAEYEIKEMVGEELRNSKNHEELRLIRQAWRTPRHALTSEFKSMFKHFDLETNEVKAQ